MTMYGKREGGWVWVGEAEGSGGEDEEEIAGVGEESVSGFRG